MEIEIVERDRRIYVVKNGVESPEYVQYSHEQQEWQLFISVIHTVGYNHPSVPLSIIADSMMDEWYTVQEAAEVLVELGAFDAPPSTQMMCTWAREGKFPAVKIQGPGGRGSGGSWRISKAGLVEFAKRRIG